MEFFRKSSEEELRNRISQEFDNVAIESLKQFNEPLLAGLMLKSAIASLYKNLKESKEMEIACRAEGINYQVILDDECKKALNRYFE